MTKKFKKINLENFQSKLKEHMHLSEGMKQKIDAAKDYYVDLWRDLKVLGNDIVTGFTQNKFFLIAAILAVPCLGLMSYTTKHENPTQKNVPITIERQLEENNGVQTSKLVAVKEDVQPGDYVEIAKCKALKNNYHATITKVLRSEFYRRAGRFDHEDKIARQLGDVINAFNENTINLKYNYAASLKVKLGMPTLTQERIHEISTNKNVELSDAEKALVVQLGVYDFLDRQLKVRATGSKQDFMAQDVMAGQGYSLLNLKPTQGEVYNQTLFKNMLAYDGAAIAKNAKQLPNCVGEICLRKSLVSELLAQNVINVLLKKLEDRGLDVDVLLAKAQKHVDISARKKVSDVCDIYADAVENDELLQYQVLQKEFEKVQ